MFEAVRSATAGPRTAMEVLASIVTDPITITPTDPFTGGPSGIPGVTL